MYIYQIRILVALVSFVAGSIPFGYLIAKYRGVDIRKYGSGNIGATNVYRTIGKKEGVLTLFLDMTKGLMCVLAAKLLLNNDPISTYISAVFVSLGHDFSIFLKFKGGKGVATTYGSTLVLSINASVIGMAIWLFILAATKYSSMSALISFSIATIICFLTCSSKSQYVFLFLLALMIFKHRGNIRRFYLKEEKKLKI